MPLGLIDLFGDVPVAEEPRGFEVTPARLVALLKWRARATLRRLPPRVAEGFHLVQGLLSTTSTHRQLRGEPPGLVGRLRPHAIVRATRTFGLPPPGASARRRLVRAMLVLPGPGDVAASLRVCLEPSASQADRVIVEERLLRIGEVLATHGVHIPFAVVPATPFDTPSSDRLRLVAFGGLFAGTLAAPVLAPPEVAPAPAEIAALAHSAPTALARLGLLALSSAPRPVEPALRHLLATQVARAAADPERLVGEWLHGHPAATAYDAALELTSGTPGPRPGPGEGADRLLNLGHRLSVHAVRGTRRATPALHPDRKRLLDDALCGGLPRALWPTLHAWLRGAAGHGPVSLDPPRESGGRYTVGASGITLGEGRTRELAVARAVALTSRVLGEPPALAPELAAWRTFAGAVSARPGLVDATVFLIDGEPGRELPADPLNSGPDRRCAVTAVRRVGLSGGRRPSCRELLPPSLVEEVVVASRRGERVISLASSPSAEPAAARVGRLARFASALGPGSPIAVECAGRVTLMTDRIRRFPSNGLARRPRAFEPDPEAPDLPFESLRRARACPGAVHVRLQGARDGQALITCTDVEGTHVSESVPVAELALHVADVERIARAAGVAVLVSTEATLAIASRLAGVPEAPIARLRVVGGEAARPVVEWENERFGGSAGLGWRALAEAVLSGWPPGGGGVLRVTEVSLDRSAGAVLRLWVRSTVRRRVLAHLAWARSAGRSWT